MQPAPARLILLPLLLSACVGLFVLALGEPRFVHAAFGLTATTVVAAPALLDRRFDWFSPWSFLLLSVTFGCGLRGLAMSAGWPDRAKIDELLIFGGNAVDFVRPGTLLIVCLSMASIGYFLLGRRPPLRPRPRVAITVNARLRFSVVLLTAVSVAAAVHYVSLTHQGGSAVSAKRAKIESVDVAGDEEVAQHGPLVHASRLAVHSLLLVVAVPLARRGRWSPGWLLAAAILFLLGLALPFYSSQRLPVMWACVSLLATVTYMRGGIPAGRLVGLTALAVGLYFVMGQIREAGEDGSAADTHGLGLVESFASKVVVHRNFLGVSKTAHIINAVPHTLPYEEGRTIAVWAVASVPRSMWPRKPLIHSGPVIGTQVYGNRISGVPPGVVAELYWNFGTTGVVLGGLLFGVGLRWAYGVLSPRTGRPAAVLLYVVGPMRLAFDIAGNSVGFGLNSMLLNCLTMGGVILLVSRSVNAPVAVPVAAYGPGRYRRGVLQPT